MGTLWPRSGFLERDNSDELAIAAKAYFYNAGTTTPKTVYQDSAESTAHPNPVVADGNGRWPTVYVPYGSYKEVRTTSADAAIGSTIDNIPNAAPFDSSVVTDPLKLYDTGHVSVGLGNETRTGFVRLNGRSIGNAASTATERANADCSALFVHVWDRCADAQAPVSGGRGGSGAADFAANKRITLPDARACGLRGFDDMGNAAAALLVASNPIVTGGFTTAGSIVGNNNHVLTAAQLAAHTHTGTTQAESAHSHSGTTDGPNQDHTHSITSATTGNVSQNHTHNFTYLQASFNVTGGAQNIITAIAATGQPNTLITSNQSQDHTHTLSATSGGASQTHTHTFSTGAGSAHSHIFTSDSTGSGTAHNNVARDLLVTFYIKL